MLHESITDGHLHILTKTQTRGHIDSQACWCIQAQIAAEQARQAGDTATADRIEREIRGLPERG